MSELLAQASIENLNLKDAKTLEGLSFEELMDASFDDLYEIPDYINSLPNGAYIVSVTKVDAAATWKSKNEDVTGLAITMKLTESMELANKTEEAPAVGSLIQRRYSGGMGAARFRKDFSKVAEAFGTKTVRDTLTRLDGALLGFTNVNSSQTVDVTHEDGSITKEKKVYMNPRDFVAVS